MKAGATETGMRARGLEMPSGADLNGYRALLLDLAKEVLGQKGALGRIAPWYAQHRPCCCWPVSIPVRSMSDCGHRVRS